MKRREALLEVHRVCFRGDEVAEELLCIFRHDHLDTLAGHHSDGHKGAAAHHSRRAEGVHRTPAEVDLCQEAAQDSHGRGRHGKPQDLPFGRGLGCTTVVVVVGYHPCIDPADCDSDFAGGGDLANKIGCGFRGRNVYYEAYHHLLDRLRRDRNHGQDRRRESVHPHCQLPREDRRGRSVADGILPDLRRGT